MNNSYSLEALLDLYSIPGIGATRMRNLIAHFKTPQNIFKASFKELCHIEGLDKHTAENLKNGPSRSFVEKQLLYLKDPHIKILSFWEDAYPERLKRIYDPPAFLFTKGDIKILQNPSVAVVGTRMPTDYGKIQTEKISLELAKNNITVISGFARGIDTIAHKTALEAGGNTIAVLGNGLNIVYPPENKKLLPSFVKKGLFISEYPFGTKPDAVNFPKRNRIISGLSAGILVTEAAEKSGALLTAMYALDQNREIFALPGPVNSSKSYGPNSLIKQGAKLVQSVEDIISELTGQLNLQKVKKTLPKLQQTEKRVYEVISNEPIHIDQIAFKSGVSAPEALAILLTLELLGTVKQMAGKMFIRI